MVGPKPSEAAAIGSEVEQPAAAGGAGALAAPAPPERAADPLAGLVPRAASGDRAATEALVRRLGPSVLGVARRILGPTHPEVEDATQEALLAVVRALEAFRGGSTVTHYATRIAVRTALRVRRRSQARQQQQESIGQREPAPSAASPSDSAIAARRRQIVCKLLESLPEEQAETLAMRTVLGMKLDEVAEVTGVPVNTVRSRVRLAREALRKRIEREPAWRELLGGAR